MTSVFKNGLNLAFLICQIFFQPCILVFSWWNHFLLHEHRHAITCIDMHLPVFNTHLHVDAGKCVSRHAIAKTCLVSTPDLFTRTLHFTRNFPDLYNTSGLIKWEEAMCWDQKDCVPFFDFQLFRDLFCWNNMWKTDHNENVCLVFLVFVQQNWMSKSLSFF